MSEALPWERALGARVLTEGEESEFRVWAPRAERVELELVDGRRPMSEVGFGVWQTRVASRAAGDYRFVLDGSALPDPCSRWQPEGLRGPSRVLAVPAPEPFTPPPLHQLVLYELHVGTFSREGTFAGAIPHLADLAGLGVNAIEIMPVAEFPGVRGWGYDGVYISAAQSSYGGPRGLRELVAAAHSAGIAVILDVVYNHVGASGVTALEAYGPYLTERYDTPWGRAINYDDEDSDPVREWVLQSAAGWITDFGIDGLRLDAIHAIYDAGADPIVGAIARRVHLAKAGALVIAESGLNDPRVMRAPSVPDDGRAAPRSRAGCRAGARRTGLGCDAAWADDFHHSLRTLLTDEQEGYYAEFGAVADLAKALRRPFVHDGGYSTFRRRRFGAPADDVPPERFVVFAQNHDQVGNRAFGDRLPARARPLAALCTLLSPFTPMLFMGEEYGEQAPFQFFSDHIDEEIAAATRDGRRAEFAAFTSFGEEVPDPQSEQTFLASKLTRKRDPELVALYAALLQIRRELPPRDADEIEFQEHDRWLRLRRGRFEIVMNFASDEQRIPCRGSTVRLVAGRGGARNGAVVSLGGLSGAVIA